MNIQHHPQVPEQVLPLVEKHITFAGRSAMRALLQPVAYSDNTVPDECRIRQEKLTKDVEDEPGNSIAGV
jgi:hypothetical protein